jgi:hypothetical protein
MKDEQSFKQFLELCKQVFERMEREGSWPWADSPNSEDLVESEDNSKDI